VGDLGGVSCVHEGWYSCSRRGVFIVKGKSVVCIVMGNDVLNMNWK